MSTKDTAVPCDPDPVIDAKLKQFHKALILHPKLAELQEKLRVTLLDCPRNSVIFVFGPSGAGKSTLREKVEKDLSKSLAAALKADRDRLPLISIEAQAPDTGTFNWRQHFKNLLERINEPLLDLRTDRKDNPINRQMGTARIRDLRQSGSAYQTSVENAIIYRKPAAIFIDEAQTIAKGCTGRRHADQMDVIKSLANRTRTPHVLVGTYDMLSLSDQSGQLARRSWDLHFSRYRADIAEEAKTFRDIIHSLVLRLPLSELPDLSRDWEYMYERSIGCVGILKDWMAWALAAALRKGHATLEFKDLQGTALRASKIKVLLTECQSNENRLIDDVVLRDELRTRMGFGSGLTNSDPTPPTEMPTGTPSALPQVGEVAKRLRKPGDRKPKRDPVGRTGSSNAA